MKYGWLPDLPDKRDLIFRSPRRLFFRIPNSVDLRVCMPPVYDQGALGSCTANATAAAIQYCKLIQGKEPFLPSRLFIYFLTRKLIDAVLFDSGGSIRDSMKVVNQWGVCREDPTWPYDISKFRYLPPEEAFKEAEGHQALKYLRIYQDVDQIRGRLAMRFPVVFGFAVYESFESEEVARTGEMPMPGPEERLMAGHAVIAVGYDDHTKRFLVRNSYGEGWGNKGYFTMPYKYMEDPNLCADFWTIELME